MILDTGICTVFRKTDTTVTASSASQSVTPDLPGSMPKIGYTLVCNSWYKEMSYETSPAWPTDGRKEQKADGRIRILQNRSIAQNDVVVLENIAAFKDRSAGAVVYRIIRAFHGQDDDGPTLISDLTLEVMKP